MFYVQLQMDSYRIFLARELTAKSARDTFLTTFIEMVKIGSFPLTDTKHNNNRLIKLLQSMLQCFGNFPQTYHVYPKTKRNFE